jgi:Cys-rich protein (TIGR01571 family)
MAMAPPVTGAVVVVPVASSVWANSLFGCDCGKCCYGCCCTACAYADLRTKYDGSNWCFNCQCVPCCATRNIVREGFGIDGSCTSDVLSTCCCPVCVYVQTAREIENPNRIIAKFNKPTDGTWTKGICSCTKGGPCFYAFCCPCCAGARARSDYDSSNCLFNFCCISAPLLVSIVREGYGIGGNCVGDVLLGTFLPCCAIHRIQQEIAARGPRGKNVVMVAAATPAPAQGGEPPKQMV